MNAAHWLVLAALAVAALPGCGPPREAAPPPPQIGRFEARDPDQPLDLDLRRAAEATQWRMRSGIVEASPRPEGLHLRTEGPDPFLSRPVSLRQGGIEQVEIETLDPTHGPFRVYLMIAGREMEMWAADAVSTDPTDRVQIANFRDLSWRYGPVEGIRLDPPGTDPDLTLVRVRVTPYAAERVHQIENESRFCVRASEVRAASSGLTGQHLLISFGVPPQARSNPGMGRLAVRLRSPDGSVSQESSHRVDLHDAGWHAVIADLNANVAPLGSDLEIELLGRDDDRLAACFPRPAILAAPRLGAPVNVLLVSIDTMRADHLEHAAYLTRLANEGRHFTQVWSSSNWTLPSHASLFTAVPVMQHNVPPPGALIPFLGVRIAPQLPMLAEALQAAGYVTGATTEGGFVGTEYGFERGFDRFDVVTPGCQGGKDSLAEHERFTREFFGTSLGKPVFLFVHTFKVHDYFLNTAEYHDLVDLQRDEGLVRSGNLVDSIRTGQIPPEYAKALYASGVRRVDEFLERLVTEVRIASHNAPLLVVVTSDHGESFGEHPGVWHHGTSMYEEQLRVPLVVWGNYPGAPTGTVAAPTSLIDVAPSLMGFLGLDAPASFAGARDRFLATPATKCKQPIVASTPQSAQAVGDSHIDDAIVDGGWKYIRSDRFDGTTLVEECFDLATDPGEQANRIADGRPECGAFPVLHAAALAGVIPSALLVRSDARLELMLGEAAGVKPIALRSAFASPGPMGRLDRGEIDWTPRSADDVLAIVLRSRPRGIERLAVGGIEAQLSRTPELGTPDAPALFEVRRAEGSKLAVQVYARELPERSASADSKAVSPELLERLRALGYTEK